jgi:hypothetical protein
MTLSDLAIAALKKTAERETATDITPLTADAYNKGLWDGYKMLAEWVLDQLMPDEVAVYNKSIDEKPE